MRIGRMAGFTSWGRGLVLVTAVVIGSASRADGLVVFGTSEEGSGFNAYEQIIDLASGHERTIQVHGASSSERGFNGRFWNYFNGTRNTIDLPPRVNDLRSETWIGQSAWRLLGKTHELTRHVSLPHASPIRLTFDPGTHRVASAVVEGDFGPVRFDFSDWRAVGRYSYPFRQEETSDLDGHIVNVVQSARFVRTVDAGLLNEPDDGAVGHLGGSAVTVAFKSIGERKTHMQVAATIDGTPGDFVFDTGGANILTTDAATTLGIRASGGINVGGAGEGTEPGGYGLVKRVAIGDASLDDQAFMIIPSPFPPSNGKPARLAGALGYEFLAHFITTIDYRAGTMTLRDKLPSDQRGVHLPFFSDGHAISVMAQVDGRPALVELDTGDGGTLTLFPAYTAANGLDRTAGVVHAIGAGAGGVARGKPGSIAHFSLAGVDFPDLPVQFSTNAHGAFASRHLAGNLGASVLHCFRITFDYPRHELWLEPQLDTPQCVLRSGSAEG